MVNFYKAYLTVALQEGIATATVLVDRITTAQGETVQTADFADFGRGILTVNPDGDGEASFPENISFTAVNSSSLAFTGAVRGLDKDGVTDTDLMRYHPVGTPVVISFGVHNIEDLKDYVDDAISAATFGINNVVTGTAGETIVAGQGVYLKNDGKWWLWDADTAATIDAVEIGIAQGAGTANNAITGGVMRLGLDTHQTGLVAGTEYYVSNTAGGISSSPGTNSRKIGVARSSTDLYFDPNYGNLPSSSEKAAMVGNVGTPSSTNKFVTESGLALGALPFGDGSDGDVTISSPTTLTRDMYYNNLTVNSTLTTDGFLIFVRGTLAGSGTIKSKDASAGSAGDPGQTQSGTANGGGGGAGGVASTTGRLRNTVGAAGQTGVSSASKNASAGVDGIAQTSSVKTTNGVAGGAAGGGYAGGSAGTSANGGAGGASTQGVNPIYTPLMAMLGLDLPLASSPTAYKGNATGGSGAGGGGGNSSGGTNSGGGGGGGSGASGVPLFISCNSWAGTFTLQAVGGNGGVGGAGGSATGFGGGGGGGGAGGNGGDVVVFYLSKTWSGSSTLTGGTGGAGGAGVQNGVSGSSGSNGTAGTLIEVDLTDFV